MCAYFEVNIQYVCYFSKVNKKILCKEKKKLETEPNASVSELKV